MTRQILLYLFLLAATSCSNQEQQQQEQFTNLQCGKIIDCKGGRVCQNGQCVNLPATTNISAPMPSTQDSDPVPVCRAGDGRVKIPVWDAYVVDENRKLSSDPPRKDGQIVYINLTEDTSIDNCDWENPNSFFLPNNKNNWDDGGLTVNIKGNTEFANGRCYFKGYFMNEESMGMMGGWVETYFGAIEMKEVILSGRYCLAKEI